MIESDRPQDTNYISGGIEVRNKIRYAVQINTTIKRSGLLSLSFNAVSIHVLDSISMLAVDILNTGEKNARPEVSAEVFDPAGNSVGKFRADPRRLYPGTSLRFELELPMLSPGKYTALLLAECAEQDIFGTNITFTVTDE